MGKSRITFEAPKQTRFRAVRRCRITGKKPLPGLIGGDQGKCLFFSGLGRSVNQAYENLHQETKGVHGL